MSTSALTTSIPEHHRDFPAPHRRSYAADTRPVTRDEETALIRRAQAGDGAAMERLIRASIRLVYRVTRRYRCRSLSQDDLVQEGIMGLITAIERFDVSQGYRLSTYAMHWIRQSVARAVGQYDQMIHVPLQVTSDARRLKRLSEVKQSQLGRVPNEAELASEAGVPEARVFQLAGALREVISLETLIGPEHGGGILERAEDETAVNPERDALWGIYRQYLGSCIRDLGIREQLVLTERFGLENGQAKTLDELSRELGISRERVRQIETRAIQKLRYALREAHWD